jgi:hypothetical protein
MLTNGVLSVNEVRAIENFNPVEYGDERFIQGAMVPVESLIEQAEANVEATEAATEAAEPQEDTEDAEDTPIPATTIREAAFALVEGAVTRLTRKESADAARAAKDAGGFLAWLDAFYGRHEAYLVEDLEHPCKALRAVGLQVLAESIAADLCRESREKLLELSGECTAVTLAKTIESEVSSWPTRKPKALIERLRA